jgi:hypothetical protein
MISGVDMADQKEAVSLELLARLSQQTLQETRALRKEVSDIRSLGLQTIEYARRIERRIDEVERRVRDQRDDLELMIKAELGGGLANMQTQLENHLQPIKDKLLGIDSLEDRVQALERKF